MSRLLTWVLRLLPVFGVLLFLIGAGAFGALPDSWWDSKGFVVNLASGLTAGCFGVPLAFFVLQRLLEERARRARRRDALTLAATNLTELQTVLDRNTGKASIFKRSRLFQGVPVAVANLLQMSSELKALNDRATLAKPRRMLGLIEKMMQYEEWLIPLGISTRTIPQESEQRLNPMQSGTITASDLRDRVQFLDGEVRIRLRAEGISLLSYDDLMQIISQGETEEDIRTAVEEFRVEMRVESANVFGCLRHLRGISHKEPGTKRAVDFRENHARLLTALNGIAQQHRLCSDRAGDLLAAADRLDKEISRILTLRRTKTAQSR